MKIKFWVKDHDKGVTMGPVIRTIEDWEAWLDCKESLQFKPFDLRYFADGKVRKEQGKKVVGSCSFLFKFIND